jgi:hypothetical protein
MLPVSRAHQRQIDFGNRTIVLLNLRTSEAVKHLLFGLWLIAGKDGSKCHRSNKQLAWELNVSEKTLERALKDAKDLGFLLVEPVRAKPYREWTIRWRNIEDTVRAQSRPECEDDPPPESDTEPPPPDDEPNHGAPEPRNQGPCTTVVRRERHTPPPDRQSVASPRQFDGPPDLPRTVNLSETSVKLTPSGGEGGGDLRLVSSAPKERLPSGRISPPPPSLETEGRAQAPPADNLTVRFVEAEVEALGVTLARTAVFKALQNRCTLEHIAAHVAEFKKRRQFGPGYLYLRLKQLRPDDAPDANWIQKSDPQCVTLKEELARERQRRQLEIERQRAQESAELQALALAERAAREARFGHVLDQMPEGVLRQLVEGCVNAMSNDVERRMFKQGLVKHGKTDWPRNILLKFLEADAAANPPAAAKPSVMVKS